MTPPSFARHATTTLGLLAILFWSTNVAFSRTVTESLGTFTAGACIYSAAGILGLMQLAVTRRLTVVLALPARYLIVCGLAFVTNLVTFYLAVGLAAGRQQVLEVGLINYLWPSMTLILSIPILHKRPNWLLLPGILLAMAGIFLATNQQGSFSWAGFVQNCQQNRLPYLMAVLAAISWGIYSCYSRALGGDTQGGTVPFFLLASGLVLCGLRPFWPEPTVWSWRAVGEFAYVAMFPTFLAYTCWDISMRKGNVVLIVALSYLIPLISTIICALHLGIPMTLTLWLACVMVIAGAAVCKKAVRD